jgi:hypothetical protein
MLATLGVLALLAGQPAVDVRSPYLDVVRQYGHGAELQALTALTALRLSKPDQITDELDTRVCAALGAPSCDPKRLAAGPEEIRARIHAAWQRLYPRALALHVEALAACDVERDRTTADLHRAILHRLIDRLDQIGRTPAAPASLASLATLGRHLLVWTLQLRADEIGLAATLDTFDADRSADVELRLAHADLDVLRSLPAALEAALRRRTVVSLAQREPMMEQEEARLLERAARGYAGVLAIDASSVEARIRLARVEARLGRIEAAAGRLRGLTRPIDDPRHAYLAALFLADVEERGGRRAEAIAAYEDARRAWPGAQTPVLGLARLLALHGHAAEARTVLAALVGRTAGDKATRADPWFAYEDGQAWRLPAAMARLQDGFEAR